MSIFSSSVARPFRRLLSASSTVAVLALVWSAGCDDSTDPQCCTMDPVCPEGAREVGACLSGECFTVSACCTTKLCEPEAACALNCEPGEVQVESCEVFTDGTNCHEIQRCDAVIHCETPAFCTAVPSCDEGDDELSRESCPDDAVCYSIELCGHVILCADNGLAHGCPEAVPVEAEPCPSFVTCEYAVERASCTETWSCMEPPKIPAPIPCGGILQWHLVESTCEGGGGGAGGGTAGGGGSGGAG